MNTDLLKAANRRLRGGLRPAWEVPRDRDHECDRHQRALVIPISRDLPPREARPAKTPKGGRFVSLFAADARSCSRSYGPRSLWLEDLIRVNPCDPRLKIIVCVSQLARSERRRARGAVTDID